MSNNSSSADQQMHLPSSQLQQESSQQLSDQVHAQQLSNQIQQQIIQQQALGFSINVDNSGLVLSAVQSQLQSNVFMLTKPDVAEIRMSVGIKIDSKLGLFGVTSFPEYTEIVIEKSKQGACLIKQLSNNSTVLSVANFSLTVDTLVNLVNSKAFATDMSQFLRIVSGSLTSSRTTSERKFWRVQRLESNGDIEITVVSLEVKYSESGSAVGSFNVGRESNTAVLNIDLLQYGVPGDMVI